MKEAKLLFQHQIVSLAENNRIPPSLLMNFNQNSLKYASVSNRRRIKKGSMHVTFPGGAFKESITATFDITYTNMFLPMQLI